MNITLKDFPFDDENNQLQWTTIRDNNHFMKSALKRGTVALEAKNVTPHHAIRVEYEGAIYYGVADENGNATLTTTPRHVHPRSRRHT